MRARIGTLFVVVFVVATVIWGLSAQTDRGSLAGTVKDVSGTPLAGVTVEASGPMTAKTVSDAGGRYRIVNLLPGDYTIKATVAGFSLTSARARVTARSETSLPIEMRAAPLPETATRAKEPTDTQFDRSAKQSIIGGLRVQAATPLVASAAGAPPVARQDYERSERGRFNT